MLVRKEKDCIIITIPEGKFTIEDGVQVPILNWTTSIPITDVERLSEYLTQEQIDGL